MEHILESSRKEIIGAAFNISPNRPLAIRNPYTANHAGKTVMSPPTFNSVMPGPPPLKRMRSSEDIKSNLDDNDNDDDQMDNDFDDNESGSPIGKYENASSETSHEPPSLVPNKNKKMTLDNLIGKIKESKTNPEASDGSSTSQNEYDYEHTFVKPPPLQQFPTAQVVPNSEAGKSRRKQAAPKAASSEPITLAENKPPPDIDPQLLDCEIVEPTDVKDEVDDDEDVEIDIADDDDEEFVDNARVSRKGRLVKRPVWADTYTDNTATDEDYTPERPGGKLKPPATKNRQSDVGASLSHADLHPSVVCDNPDPKWLIPFKTGWKRELVIRNPQDDDASERKTNADAYYYAPSDLGGLKLRSAVKIEEFLMENQVPGLTGANFTFQKRAIYREPDEFVRQAGKTGRRGAPAPKAHSPKPLPEKKPIQPKREPVTPSSSSVAFSPRATRQASAATPEVYVSPPKKKIKADRMATERAKAFLNESPVSQFKVLAPAGKPPQSLEAMKPPCSNACQGVKNSVPSLQCGVCLLLYHPECVNWATTNREALFVCAVCIMKSKTKQNQKDSPVPGGAGGDNKMSNHGSTPIPLQTRLIAPLPSSAITQTKQIVVKGTSATNLTSDKLDPSKAGRLITIPLSVLDKIDMNSSFALKLNNETYKIDPKNLVKTPQGVKIFIRNDQMVKPNDPGKYPAGSTSILASAGAKTPAISASRSIISNISPQVSHMSGRSMESASQSKSKERDSLMSLYKQMDDASALEINDILGLMLSAIEKQESLSKAPLQNGREWTADEKAILLNKPVDTRLSGGKNVSSMSEVLYEAARAAVKAGGDRQSVQTTPVKTLPPLAPLPPRNSQVHIPVQQVAVPVSAMFTVSNGGSIAAQRAVIPRPLVITQQSPRVAISPHTGHLPRASGLDSVTRTHAPPIPYAQANPALVSSLTFTPQLPARQNQRKSPTAVSPSATQPTRDMVERSCQTDPVTLARVVSASSSMNALQAGYKALLHILSYLPLHDLLKAHYVCKSWNMAARSPMLYKKFSIQGDIIKDVGRFVDFIAERNVTHLELLGATATGLVSVCSNSLPRLRSLSVSSVQRDSNDTHPKSEVCQLGALRRLEKLSLHISDHAVCVHLMGLSNASHLQQLRVTGHQSLSVEDLELLGELPELRSLELGDCESWTPAMLELVLSIPKLESLHLHKGPHCQTGSVHSVTDSTIRSLTLTNFTSHAIGAVITCVSGSVVSLSFTVSSLGSVDKDLLANCHRLTSLNVVHSRVEMDPDELEYLRNLYAITLPQCDVNVTMDSGSELKLEDDNSSSFTVAT